MCTYASNKKSLHVYLFQKQLTFLETECSDIKPFLLKYISKSTLECSIIHLENCSRLAIAMLLEQYETRTIRAPATMNSSELLSGNSSWSSSYRSSPAYTEYVHRELFHVRKFDLVLHHEDGTEYDGNGCFSCFLGCKKPLYPAGQHITGYLLIRPMRRLVITGELVSSLILCCGGNPPRLVPGRSICHLTWQFWA